jgi:hypothetical protein
VSTGPTHGHTVARHESEVDVPARRGVGGLEPSAAYLDFVLETARAPPRASDAVRGRRCGGPLRPPDLEDRTDLNLVAARSDMLTDIVRRLTTQTDGLGRLGGYV